MNTNKWSGNLLYIFIFLHQTTTLPHFAFASVCCISLYSYIKPQPGGWWYILASVVYLYIPTSNHNAIHELPLAIRVVYLYIPTSNHNTRIRVRLWICVVYLYIPTSNHNCKHVPFRFTWLYIFIFLHQTTTISIFLKSPSRCISLYSYIKPQPPSTYTHPRRSCISLYSYIKPQRWPSPFQSSTVVYLYIPTSNHNKASTESKSFLVVYLYIPTSNHNITGCRYTITRLYIFIFLHQTTT